MNRYISKEARQAAVELNELHASYGPVRERVTQPDGSAFYNLMNLVFRGTDIEDIARYPKKTGKEDF